MVIVFYGTKRKQEKFSVKLDFKHDKCKCKDMEMIFNFSKPHIYWIPISSWSIEDCFLYCSKCEKLWRVNEKDKRLEEIYKKFKKGEKINLDFKTVELDKDLNEIEKKYEEDAERLKQENQDFKKFIITIGILVALVIFALIIRAVFF